MCMHHIHPDKSFNLTLSHYLDLEDCSVSKHMIGGQTVRINEPVQ